MALPNELTVDPKDPRAVRILAKSLYRELRGEGFDEQDVMALASELLGLVAGDVRSREGAAKPPSEAAAGGLTAGGLTAGGLTAGSLAAAE